VEVGTAQAGLGYACVGVHFPDLVGHCLFLCAGFAQPDALAYAEF
jgi:hypothetical protein